MNKRGSKMSRLKIKKKKEKRKKKNSLNSTENKLGNNKMNSKK